MLSPERARTRSPTPIGERTPPTRGYWSKRAARKEQERIKRETDAMCENDPMLLDEWSRTRETWAMQRHDDFFLLYPEARDLD